MRFESPWWLLLILLLPLWWWFLVHRQKSEHIIYSPVSSLQQIVTNAWWTHPYFLPSIRALILFLLILALARPQTGRSFSEVDTEGVDLILAIDTSGSMKALDLTLQGKNVTRLEVVQSVLADFIQQRKSDRIGLVVFGDEAFTQAPLTHDHELLQQFLDKLFIGMAGQATAIGNAIGISTKRLKDLKAESKIMILLTDGENTAGSLNPIVATEVAKKLGIKIYTIGVGSRGKAPFEVDGFFGKQIIYQQVNLDEKLLQQIATLTEGQYFLATNTEALQEIYRTIDNLEKTVATVKEYHEYTDHFHWFLIPALCLFLIEYFLKQTRLRTIP